MLNVVFSVCRGYDDLSNALETSTYALLNGMECPQSQPVTAERTNFNVKALKTEQSGINGLTLKSGLVCTFAEPSPFSPSASCNKIMASPVLIDPALFQFFCLGILGVARFDLRISI